MLCLGSNLATQNGQTLFVHYARRTADRKADRPSRPAIGAAVKVQEKGTYKIP
jgi:hypothetical protein